MLKITQHRELYRDIETISSSVVLLSREWRVNLASLVSTNPASVTSMETEMRD
jgi:hypothetical protein